MCHSGGQRFGEMGEERQEMGFSPPPCAGMWALFLSALISTQEIEILILLRQSCEARCIFAWDLYWAVNGMSATSKLRLQNQSRLAEKVSKLPLYVPLQSILFLFFLTASKEHPGSGQGLFFFFFFFLQTSTFFEYWKLIIFLHNRYENHIRIFICLFVFS